MIQISRIARTGHSVYVILPKAMVRELGLSRRDQVAVALIGNAIAITKVDPARLFDMSRIRGFAGAAKAGPSTAKADSSPRSE